MYTGNMSDAAKTDEERHFTYADYKAWELKEGKRFELVGGTAWAMAVPNDFHQAILVELVTQMANYLRGKPCKVRPGAPDLVVEILSPTNTADEYIRKFSLYMRAGVREYWVVAPESKTVQAFVLRDGAYTGMVYDAAAVLPSAILEGLSITLGDVFAG